MSPPCWHASPSRPQRFSQVIPPCVPRLAAPLHAGQSVIFAVTISHQVQIIHRAQDGSACLHAPEFAFLPPLGDLFVILQPGSQMRLFINRVKVVRKVGINSDVWLLIMLEGNDDLNGSLLSDYPQLNAIPILFYLYTISTILPNVNIWNLIAGERTFSTNFQRKVQIRMCWKTSWKHFVKK